MDVVAYFALLFSMVAWFIRGAWRITKREHPVRIFAVRALFALGTGFVLAGLKNSFHIEPTQEALRLADWGHRQLAYGAVMVIAAAIAAHVHRQRETASEKLPSSQG